MTIAIILIIIMGVVATPFLLAKRAWGGKSSLRAIEALNNAKSETMERLHKKHAGLKGEIPDLR